MLVACSLHVKRTTADVPDRSFMRQRAAKAGLERSRILPPNDDDDDDVAGQMMVHSELQKKRGVTVHPFLLFLNIVLTDTMKTPSALRDPDLTSNTMI